MKGRGRIRIMLIRLVLYSMHSIYIYLYLHVFYVDVIAVIGLLSVSPMHLGICWCWMSSMRLSPLAKITLLYIATNFVYSITI